MVHHIFLSRGIAQLVEQRSPKPRAEGSNPSALTAASITLIVAPTEDVSKKIWFPTKRSA